MNVLFGLAIVEATRRLALRLFGSERGALMAALVVALHPNGIAYSSLLMGETLSCALLLWSLVFLLEKEAGDVWRTVLAGVLLGGAIIVRPQMAPILAVVLLARTFLDRPRGSISLLIRGGLAYVAAFVLLLPWTLRNRALYDAWPVLSNNDGVNLYIGNNPRANGTYYLDFVVESAYWDAPDEYRRNLRARDSAIAWITGHPGDFFQLIPLKLWHLWRADTEGITWNKRWFPKEIVTPITRVYDLLKWGSELWWICFVSLVALIVLRRRKYSTQWSWAGISVVAWISMLGIIYFGDGRFHFVAVPFMAMMIGAGVKREKRCVGTAITAPRQPATSNLH